nr:permease prefix domain 1-containing protein [Leucobacter luti]
MFSAYPQTPRLLEAKAELHGMMEDAYTSLIAEGRSENEAVGQVISDFGNLAEVAPELGITSELGIAAGSPAAAAPTVAPAAGAPAGGAAAAGIPAAARPTQPADPPVTIAEASGYADAHERTRYRTAIAIALFVISPAKLIWLTSAASEGVIPLASGPATLIGVFALLLLVAVGVMLLISSARELTPFNRLESGRFTPTAEVTAWSRELAQRHERSRIRALQIAVLLWILSPAPLLTAALLNDSPTKGTWVASGVVALLLVVAIGLLVLLPTAWAHTVAEKLDRRGPAPQAEDDDPHSIVGVIASFYWPLLTAIYLGWSFIGDAWGQSWVLWPIGAVLFGAIAAGGGAWESYRRARR